MKTFKEYLATHRSRFLFALVLSLAAGLAYYTNASNLAATLVWTGALMLCNLSIWFALSAANMWKDWVALTHRMRWEASMLNSLQLARAAESYYIDDANVLSAFHAMVQSRQDEGVKRNWLDLGEL